MALEIEGVVDRGMHAEEALGRSSDLNRIAVKRKRYFGTRRSST
jgi:hypothetical protein